MTIFTRYGEHFYFEVLSLKKLQIMYKYEMKKKFIEVDNMIFLTRDIFRID